MDLKLQIFNLMTKHFTMTQIKYTSECISHIRLTGIIYNSRIGKRISTKLPIGKPMGKQEYFCYDRYREDVTNQYKHTEGNIYIIILEVIRRQ